MCPGLIRPRTGVTAATLSGGLRVLQQSREMRYHYYIATRQPLAPPPRSLPCQNQSTRHQETRSPFARLSVSRWTTPLPPQCTVSRRCRKLGRRVASGGSTSVASSTGGSLSTGCRSIEPRLCSRIPAVRTPSRDSPRVRLQARTEPTARHAGGAPLQGPDVLRRNGDVRQTS